jgi:hypothetical protein
MNQNKRTLKVLVVFGIIAILAAAGIAAFAFQGASNEHGQLTVTIPTHVNAGTGDRLIELRNRIAHARNLLETVDTAEGGTRTHWAPLTNHTSLQNAVNAAEGVEENVRMYRRNETFDVTVNIAGNSGGFSGMTLRLNLPAGLELVSVTPGTSFRTPANFQGGPGWNSTTFAVSPARTGNISVGWSGRQSGNYTGDGNLVTFGVRVTNNAAQDLTAPITMGFGSNVEPFHDRPTRNVGSGVGADQGSLLFLNMSIQGVNMPETYTPVDLGRIYIRP